MIAVWCCSLTRDSMKPAIAGYFQPGGNICGCGTWKDCETWLLIFGNRRQISSDFQFCFFREMRIRWRGAQPQIFHGSTDGEMIKALPVVPGQPQRIVHHV